jgi:hypothetical protein
MLQLHIIECLDGVWITGFTGPILYQVNGESAQMHRSVGYKDWALFKAFPVKITKKIDQKKINERFELKDKTLVSESRPLVVAAGRDEDYDLEPVEPYSDLAPLYEYKYDLSEEKYEEIPFTVENHQKVNAHLTDFAKLNIEGVKPTNYTLDQLMTPALLLEFRPNYLTSKQVLEIIRNHVKRHIDPTKSKIVSDYDFHFKVDKIIHLDEKEAYQANIAGWKAKKPKYETRYRDTRSLTILDIASESKWGPVIPEAISGTNFAELKAKVQSLLKNIMTIVNQTATECPHCEGRGVHFDTVKL